MRHLAFLVAASSLLLAGCPSEQINPFQTVTEQFGAQSSRDEDTEGGGGGSAAAGATFRRAMQVTLNNNNPDADLELSILAWVNVSSIRSADQQDALIMAGYRQITRELRVGSAITLPIGTFVCERAAIVGALPNQSPFLFGEGTAGAIPIFMRRTSAEGPPSLSLIIETPDAILFYKEPPDSCDSVAFEFTLDGFPIDAEPVPGALGDVFESSAGRGGLKTLAQVNLYQCFPFTPGVYLRAGGAKQRVNEFFEGESIVVDFNAVADAEGDFAIIAFQ